MEGWPPTRSRFRPGQSGNPGGRPKSIRLALRKAAKHSPRSIQFLVETMNDEKQDPCARIAAAKLILDRGLGKVTEVILPPEPVQKREVTPEDLRYMTRILRIDNYTKQGWRIPPDLIRLRGRAADSSRARGGVAWFAGTGLGTTIEAIQRRGAGLATRRREWAKAAQALALCYRQPLCPLATGRTRCSRTSKEARKAPPAIARVRCLNVSPRRCPS